MKTLAAGGPDAPPPDWAAHMRRALALAGSVASASPNPRVGCVLARGGDVVAEGWHAGAGAPHAEAMALAAAGAAARGAAAFVSLEPCRHEGRTGPCVRALAEAGVSAVALAGLDPNPQMAGRGAQELGEAGIDVFHLADFEEPARAVNPGYFKRLERGLPRVRIKLAMSLDGRTALAGGESKWITGPAARADVQRLRAESCAVLTGVGTVLADDPGLDLRPAELPPGAAPPARRPRRVVLDSRLRTPAGARVLEAPDPAIVFARDDAPRAAAGKGATVRPLRERDPRHPERIDPAAVLTSLAREFLCNEVLVEAGPTLCAAFLMNGLADELIVYIAPRLFGRDARALLDIGGIRSLDDAVELALADVARVGDDLRVVLRPRAR